MTISPAIRNIFRKIFKTSRVWLLAITLGIVSTVAWEFFLKPYYEQYQAKSRAIDALATSAVNDRSIYVRSAAVVALAGYKTAAAQLKLREIALSQSNLAPLVSQLQRGVANSRSADSNISNAIAMASKRDDLVAYERSARTALAYKIIIAQLRSIKSNILKPGNLTAKELSRVNALGIVESFDAAIDRISEQLAASRSPHGDSPGEYVTSLIAAQEAIVRLDTSDSARRISALDTEEKLLEIAEKIHPAFDSSFGDPNLGRKIEIDNISSLIGLLSAERRSSELPKLIQDGSTASTFRIRSVEALGDSLDESHLPLLLRLLSDSDPLVRIETTRAIGKIGGQIRSLPSGGQYEYAFPFSSQTRALKSSQVRPD